MVTANVASVLLFKKQKALKVHIAVTAFAERAEIKKENLTKKHPGQGRCAARVMQLTKPPIHP